MRFLLLLCLALPALGANVQQRIVGGRNAFIGNHKHMLSLRENGVHTCGASLIGTTRAVSAAACLGSAIGVYNILGGTADRTISSCSTCVTRDLNFLIRNPLFDANGAGYSYDIAVIGFVAVTLNEALDIINMATPSDGDFVGSACTITGWGEDMTAGEPPLELQVADITAMSSGDCEANYGQSRIDVSHLCAFTSGVAACTDDEGGPLVCGGLLAGVYSWGEACSSSWPSVFSKISYFHAWIIAQ